MQQFSQKLVLVNNLEIREKALLLPPQIVL